MLTSFFVCFAFLSGGVGVVVIVAVVVGAIILETFGEGVDGELTTLITSSDFFGVEKVVESCEPVVFDGEIIGLAFVGLAPAAVCFLRGSVDLITSGLETISCAILFGGDELLLIAVSSCKFFAIACMRAFVLSFTSSTKRSDIIEDGVDTVDTDELLLGDVNCFGISVFCSETVADGVADVTLFSSAVCALLTVVALTDRDPVVAERGVCCNGPDFNGLTGTVFGVCNGCC